MKTKTKHMATIAMLSAISFMLVFLVRIPIVLFLHYEPKDVIIVLGGFIWGPLTALLVSLICAFIELITISMDGILGFVMNVLASAVFACTAALIYKRNHSVKNAVLGLIAGSVLMIGIMLLWNYIITPIYLNIPREQVVALLVPAILPFNFIKASLNSALALLLYRPLINALRAAGLLEGKDTKKRAKTNYVLIFGSLVVIATAVLLALVVGKII